MRVTIRPATIDDGAAIARVQVASWRSTYAGIVPQAHLDSLDVESRAQLWCERIAAAKVIFFVAEDQDGVLGFVCGGALRESIPEYDSELYAIYLLSERQRQGVGRDLVLALMEAVRAAGFKSMAVWVLEKNAAVGFYERLGAVRLMRKPIEIGGAKLDEIAFGWPILDAAFPPDSPE